MTDKRPLDVPEMLSIIQQLLVAGNETTTKLLTETMRLLAENPDEWTRLKQDPTRAPQIVEEALRLSTPTQGMFRISTKDHELGGVHIPKGARIVIVFASANRDESLYPDPDGFDPDRDNLRDHLAFGKGIHFCLGAALSRLEGKVALEELSQPARELLAARDQRVPVLPELPAPRTHATRRRRRPGGCSLMAGPLAGKIAVVTGSSRGIGRGTAIALGEQGATVYVTGRSTGDGELTIDRTAALVDDAGGHGIAVQTDHGDDDQIAALFDRVRADQGKLDILVNNVYKIPDPPAWGGGFWDHPISIWDDQVGIGLRAHYVASWHAAPLLFEAGPGGFICNISSPGGQSYHFSSSYGAGKAGLDRLGADMAIELEPKGIAVVTVYPGTVSTEFIVEWSGKRDTDMDGAQTPLVVGRSVAALATASGPDGAVGVDPVGRGSRRGVRPRRRTRPIPGQVRPPSLITDGPPRPRPREDRRRSVARTWRMVSTTCSALAPGVMTAAMPASFSGSTSWLGTMPPTTTGISLPSLRTSSTTSGARVMWAPESIDNPIASTSSSTAAAATVWGVWNNPV